MSRHFWRTAAATLASLLLMVSAGTAQVAVPPVPVAADTLPGDTVARSVPSPAGAFLRSVLVPGWGQAAYGSYIRGGVFFAAQTGSWFMVFKTMGKLAEARQIETKHIGAIRDSLLAAAQADPELAKRYEDPLNLEIDLDKSADANDRVRVVRDIIGSREQQREDWIAVTLFWMLAGGVDALVNAHLSDFPARVVAEPRPGGGLDLGLRVPAGGRP